MKAFAIGIAAIASVAGCDRPASSSERGAVQRSETARQVTAVDTSDTPLAALRRFRVGLDSPAYLDGPRSRDALVKQFFAALRAGDRPALERLAMTQAEFAYLVFPDSRWIRPPYNQPADLEWLLLKSKSDPGLTRLLRRFGTVEPVSYSCLQPPEMDGGVKYWPGCLVRMSDRGRTADMKLFGSIIELNGRFKFRDYNNAF